MKTFKEFLKQRDAELYNEIKMPKFTFPAIAGGALALAGLAGSGDLFGKTPESPSNVSQSENLGEKEKAEKTAIKISRELTGGNPLEQDDGNVYIKIPYSTTINKEEAIKKASDIGTRILRNKGYEVNQSNIVARVDRTGSIILVVKKLNNSK